MDNENLRSHPVNVPVTLNYPRITIYEAAAGAAAKYPDDTAYEFMGKKTSYRMFIEEIEKTAKALTAAGIGRGDRVTIAMPNCPQAVCMFYAVNRIGAISNMVHPLSAPGEYRHYINFSHSKAVLVLDRFYAKVAEIRHELKDPVTVITAHISDALPFPLNMLYRLKTECRYPAVAKNDAVDWKDFIDAGKKMPALQNAGMDCDEGAVILYSGGTTGTTKGILLSSMNFNALGLQTAAASGLPTIHGLKMLSIMPLFHGFGLGIGIHTMLIGGGTCILVPQFSLETYASLLRKKKPDFIAGVPTLFEALLRADNLDGADLSCLKGVFSGGDSLSVELKAKVDKFLSEHNASVQIREGYGTTECVTASCLNPPDYYREGSIGLPYPDTFYKIVEPGTTEEVPAGTAGEICIRGPSVMIGYLDNEEETKNTLRRHPDGYTWLHTGDLGKMDEDGFVYFKQRIKRMIITSGYNVYPSQVENIIDSHPKVLYSCVIGVKDPYKIQKVKAFVVLRPPHRPSDDIKAEIVAHCEKNIVKYAIPYDIEFRTELPKTLVGKVAYRRLEEEEDAKNPDGAVAGTKV